MDKKVNGLKGICCLIVAVGHAFAIVLPEYYFGDIISTNFVGAKFVYSSPLNFMINGSSALFCFLILSGYVIPLKKLESKNQIGILSKMMGKYLRLMPMVMIGCLFSWVIMKLDLVYSVKLIDASGGKIYAGIYNNFVPENIISVDGPIIDAMVKTFLGWSRYDSPLGSIGWIWLFSAVLLLYTEYLSDKMIRYPIYVFTIIVLILLHGVKYEMIYLAPMISGMVICDLKYNEINDLGNSVLQCSIIDTIVCIIGICMITVPRGSFTNGPYTWALRMNIPVFYYWMIGWGIVIYVIEKKDLFNRFLSCKLIQYLGNISFAIYAVHWPIIISITSVIVYYTHYKLGVGYELSGWIAIVLSLPCIICTGYVVDRYPYRRLYDMEMYIKKIIRRS